MTHPLHHHLLPVFACICFLYGAHNVYKQSLMGQPEEPKAPPIEWDEKALWEIQEPSPPANPSNGEAALKDLDSGDAEAEKAEDPMRRGLHPGEVIRKKVKKRWNRLPAIRHADGLPKKSDARFA